MMTRLYRVVHPNHMDKNYTIVAEDNYEALSKALRDNELLPYKPYWGYVVPEEPQGEDVSPDGKKQHEAGAKLDKGKPRVALVMSGFSKALMKVAEVGTFGANKYSDSGWVEVKDGVNRYDDAMLRHYLAEKSGEVLDDESGLMHHAHFAWNALATLELKLMEMEQDDANIEGNQ